MRDADFNKHGVKEEGPILDLRSIQNEVRVMKEAMYPVIVQNFEVKF